MCLFANRGCQLHQVHTTMLILIPRCWNAPNLNPPGTLDWRHRKADEWICGTTTIVQILLSPLFVCAVSPCVINSDNPINFEDKRCLTS